MSKLSDTLKRSIMWSIGYKLLRAFLGLILSAIIGWLVAHGWMDKSSLASGDIQKLAEFLIVTGGAVWVGISTWRRTIGQHIRAIVAAAMHPSTLEQVDNAIKSGVTASVTTPNNVLPKLPEGHQ